MNLLLVLSALLSALSGASGGTRPAQPVAAVALAASLATSAREVPATATVLPTIAPPTLAAVAAAPAWRVAPTSPMFLSSRRE